MPYLDRTPARGTRLHPGRFCPWAFALVWALASFADAMARKPALIPPGVDTLVIASLADVESALGTTSESIQRTPIADSLSHEWEDCGVRWYRNEINWKDCEIGRRGEYAFPGYRMEGNPHPIEAFFDSLQSHRITPYVLLNGGNALYGASGAVVGESKFDLRNPGMNMLSPEGFSRFCAAFASRFRDRVRYFEIGNEPHNYLFWDYFAGPEDRHAGRIWGPHLIEYFNAAAEAIKRVHPKARILSPGEDDGGLAAAERYLPAIAKHVDILAIHPYVNDADPTPEGSYAYAIEPYLRLAKANGIGETWITEIGWAAPPDGAPGPQREEGRRTTALGQAKYLCRGLFFYPIRCGIKVVGQFCWTGGDRGWQIRAPAKRALRNLAALTRNSSPAPALSAWKGTMARFAVGPQAGPAADIERYLLIKTDKVAYLAFWFRAAQDDAFPKRSAKVSLSLPGGIRVRAVRSHDLLDGSVANVPFAVGPSGLVIDQTWITDYPNLVELDLK